MFGAAELPVPAIWGYLGHAGAPICGVNLG